MNFKTLGRKVSQNKTTSMKGFRMALESAHDGLKEAVSIVVHAGDKILMGVRKDSLLWTLPGGHKELNESPYQGAVRELFEETGIRIDERTMELKSLGNKMSDGGVLVHAFSLELNTIREGSREITTKYDPDDEVKSWEWIEHNGPNWDDVLSKLQHPKNIAFELMRIM